MSAIENCEASRPKLEIMKGYLSWVSEESFCC